MSEEKTRILFVDDDANVLSGLRRMLRSMRGEWTMEFAPGGNEAIEMMKSAPFEVVVSDMKMPGMSGAELLAEVMADYPDTIRFILSGHADNDQIMTTIGPTHQFLSKPCDSETLKTAVQRALGLKGVLSSPDLRALVSKLDTLPSLPALFTELREELQKEDPSVKRVSEIVAGDVSMTAKTLQLVNSAFFGLRQEVTDISQAVSYLGLETIGSLVLSAKAFSEFEHRDADNPSVERLWGHSVRCAMLARSIAETENAESAVVGASFLSGMLHDVGKLVLTLGVPERYSAVVSTSISKGVPIWETEAAEFGTTHAEVGGYLLGLWGIPDAIVEAVARHHQPSLAPSCRFSALTAVHAADALDAAAGGAFIDGVPSALDADYIEALGLSGRLETWRNMAQTGVAQGA